MRALLLFARKAHALAPALVAVGCSASHETTDTSVPLGLDGSERLVALSTSERQNLCDWLNQREGGYGKTILCEASGTPLDSDASQAECVTGYAQQAARFPSCPTTVGQYQTCIEWFLANWCTNTTLVLPPDCAAFQDQCFPSAGNPGLPLDGGRGPGDASYPQCDGPLPEDSSAVCGVNGSGPRD